MLRDSTETRNAELRIIQSVMKKYTDDDIEQLVERVDALGGYL